MKKLKGKFTTVLNKIITDKSINQNEFKQEKAQVRFAAPHASNPDRQCRSGWCGLEVRYSHRDSVRTLFERTYIMCADKLAY